MKMQEQVSQETLLLAKNGDTLVREELIRSHKTFIAQVSSKICSRYLTWDNDDELSIALLAFNEAIDTFEPHGRASFLSFVQMVIRRYRHSIIPGLNIRVQQLFYYLY